MRAPPKPPSVAPLLVPQESPISLEPGERLVADATVLGVPVGTLDMRLHEKCGASDSGRWTLESTLGTAGVARWFDKTKGTTTSTVNSRDLLPVESTTVVIKGDEWRRYHLAFEAGSYRYFQTRSNGEGKEGTEVSPGREPIHDTQTAYLLLRTWQPKPNEQSYFYVVLGKDLWRADVQYRGKVSLETDDGVVPARHLEGMAHRINLGPGDEYTPRAFQLWLSDDDRRIPLVVVGDGSLGSIRFALSERTLLAPCRAADAAPQPPAASPAAPSSEAVSELDVDPGQEAPSATPGAPHEAPPPADPSAP